MTALLGITGNSQLYKPYLKELGAADARDDVFAAVVWCPGGGPGIDSDYRDIAAEWFYSSINTEGRALTPEEDAKSKALASLFPAYLKSLNLRRIDNGEPLTEANYIDYYKTFLMQTAQRVRNAGTEIPEETGVILDKAFGGKQGQIVLDVDLKKFFNYITKTEGLQKRFNVAPNPFYGNEKGGGAYTTDYAIQLATGDSSIKTDPDVKRRHYLLSPINHLDDQDNTVSRYWYIRHGTIDPGVSPPVPMNLATKLSNIGCNVDFSLAWNRNHQQDYDLDSLFAWVKTVVQK
jgi:hypothetical protein